MVVEIRSMSNILYKIRGKILRFFASLIKWRPDSYPYLSGDGLRCISDKIYDEQITCKAKEIKIGDIVFVSSEKLFEWFTVIHKDITQPYILISHNGDSSVNEKIITFLDNKIIHWFAQNNTYTHTKITPLPIGIENRKWFMSGWYLLSEIQKLKRVSSKKNRVLYGFNVKTNIQERSVAKSILDNTKVADSLETRIKPKQYFHILNNYKFVASPEGNGSDCHRTWEAIILGVIPILRNVSHNQIFKKRDMPVLLVNEWKELENITENDLNMIYNQLSIIKCDEIFLEYWMKLIFDTKKDYLKTTQ